MDPQHGLTAILPCNDLNVSEAFYRKLGFARADGSSDFESTYRILSDGKGGHLHLVDAVRGWLVPGRNPFGLYLYTPDVDELRNGLPTRFWKRKSNRKTSRGACTSSPSAIPTRHWYGLAGRPGCATPRPVPVRGEERDRTGRDREPRPSAGIKRSRRRAQADQ